MQMHYALHRQYLKLVPVELHPTIAIDSPPFFPFRAFYAIAITITIAIAITMRSMYLLRR